MLLLNLMIKNQLKPPPPIEGFYKDSPEFYSKKGNRIFYFESFIKDFSTPSGVGGRMAVRRYAEKQWQLLPDDALTILED